jgi:hypothetical protein
VANTILAKAAVAGEVAATVAWVHVEVLLATPDPAEVEMET